MALGLFREASIFSNKKAGDGIACFLWNPSPDYSAGRSPSTIGWEVSNPKPFGAMNIKTITMAIEARNVAVLAMSLTVLSFYKFES